VTPADLFVYGTLRSGCDNPFARLLSRSAAPRGAGKVQGRLFLIENYPGAVPSSDESQWVFGEVWTLRTPETTLAVLDDYEGCGPRSPLPHEFRRAEALAYLPEPVLVWIYWYNFDPRGKRIIPGGRFAGC